jgi:hypothetical protein
MQINCISSHYETVADPCGIFFPSVDNSAVTVRLRLIHTNHTAPVPCHDHAILKQNAQGHGAARRGHGMACMHYYRSSRDGMCATCQRSASSGYHAEFHEVCYQKHTNPLNCATSCSDISGYLADLHEGQGTVGKWQRAWLVWINAARHGMVTAWARHPMWELALRVRLVFPERRVWPYGRILTKALIGFSSVHPHCLILLCDFNIPHFL